MTETATLLTFDTPMLVSAIILLLTFIGVFTEELHGLHRSKFALAGAVAMMLLGQYFGFYHPEVALEKIDWNVVLLLGAMMTIVSILAPTGGFQALAYTAAKLSRGRLFVLLILLGVTTALLSMFLDNVTTVVIIGPIVFLIAQALRVSPLPFLIGISLMAVIGGIATIIGDPTSIMIGSAAGLDFTTYLTHMGGMVAVGICVILLTLRWIFRAELRQTVAASDFSTRGHIKDGHTWYVALAVLALMIVLFVIHAGFGWEPWTVGVIGLAIIMLFSRRVDVNKVFEDVEITLLMFLVSLFIVIGGVEESHFLAWVAQFLTGFMQADLLTGTLVLLWVAAILSAVIDNIPFVAAMIPIILGLESQGVNVAPLWWGLALGAGIGGLGSHVGSAVNVFIVSLSERIAKQTGDHSLAITPGLWLCKATPAAIVSLIVISVLLYSFFPFFEAPFEKVAAHSSEILTSAK